VHVGELTLTGVAAQLQRRFDHVTDRVAAPLAVVAAVWVEREAPGREVLACAEERAGLALGHEPELLESVQHQRREAVVHHRSPCRTARPGDVPDAGPPA
jgi:hypothetical protein